MHLWAKTCAILLVLWPWVGTASFAAEGEDALACDRAAAVAAQQTNVPQTVLQAVARVESGRTLGGAFAPWPWSVNIDGRAHYFASAELAVSETANLFDLGAPSADIGCFQLNTRWHGHAFASLDQMFDPGQNALYAAEYLRDLYAQYGNWGDAVGAYHSKDATLAQAYLTRVQEMLETRVAAQMIPQAPPETRANQFPLLQAGKGAGRGSLVPVHNAAATPFFR